MVSGSGTQELAKATILVVDDEKVNLHLWRMLLTKAGYAVQTVADSTSVLATVKDDPPDLLLLDIMMPHITGYEICERLKADPVTRAIPVIFLSALHTLEDKVKGFEVGGVDYISKPFQVKEVLARLETHLKLRQLQKSMAEKNVQLQREIAVRQQAEFQLRGYADRLRTLHELDQSILVARSSETIAIAAVGRIRHLIPCQRVLVIAVSSGDDSAGQLKTLAADSSGDIALSADAEIYHEILENPILQAGRPYGVQNMSMLPSLSPLQEKLYQAGVLAYVIVPLFMHGELLGSLHLESIQPAVFDATHVTVATEISVLLAIAIRQVHLYELAQQEIAERKLVEEALRQQTLALEAHNAELDAYAHTVAHDLKSPLASLVGFSHILRRRYAQMAPKKLEETLDFISASARRMAVIIDELLLLASVRKMEEIPLAPLDMANVIVEVQKRLKGMITRYEAELHIAEVWPLASGYGPWIEEVWVNYVSNAIKYGGTPPVVELGMTILDDDWMRFWVRDNGAGLAEKQQAQLFSSFTRLNRARAEGHGLGLSIVLRIIKKLGGTVGVESEIGGGSEFYFTLPRFTIEER